MNYKYHNKEANMNRFATLDTEQTMGAKLRVVGVGGGGCNAINSMINRGLGGVEYIAINTDTQDLEHNGAAHKIQVGKNVTRGLGAGADPNIGRKAVEEDREKIAEVLEGSDMVFVTAGMGGGTGTGGTPIIASIAKSVGSLVIGIVTKPFRWEGKRRMMNAEEGIHDLGQYVDSLIVIPNERLLNIIEDTVSANEAFDKPNEVLYEATRGIADIITIPGRINVDFADVRAVMNESGEALMGCGSASGENRAVEAAQKAISSPLLEGINIEGAQNILLNVTGSGTLSMKEINEGNQIIYDAAGEEANVIFGWVNKEEMNEYVNYTVIATGFKTSSSQKSKTQQQQESKTKQQEVETETFGGGYRIGQRYELEDTENLDIPTIYRVKGSKDKLSGRDIIPRSGFKSEEQLDAFREENDSKNSEESNENNEDNNKENEEKNNNKRNRGSDSSSFLRMMMD